MFAKYHLQFTGVSKNQVKLKWDGNDCSSVEVSGLDIGWGQVMVNLYFKLSKYPTTDFDF